MPSLTERDHPFIRFFTNVFDGQTTYLNAMHFICYYTVMMNEPARSTQLVKGILSYFQP